MDSKPTFLMNLNKSTMFHPDGRRTNNGYTAVTSPQDVLVNHLIYQGNPQPKRKMKVNKMEFGI